MKYAFFDIDGTIYKGFSSNDLIEYLFENGIITSKLYPEYESMVEDFMSGNIPYNNAVTMFVKYFGKVLTGLQEHEIESINVRLIKENNKLFRFHQMEYS